MVKRLAYEVTEIALDARCEIELPIKEKEEKAKRREN